MENQISIPLNVEEGKVLYITSEKVIVNLLKVDQKKYLPIPRLYRFVAFLWKQLQDNGAYSSGIPIVFDVNFDSIERTVQYNDLVYDLVGDNIYLKGRLPDLEDDEDFVSLAARRFVDTSAA